MHDSVRLFPNCVCTIIIPPYFLPLTPLLLVLFARFLLLTGTDEIGVADVATVPAGENASR
jgi:hypothetical protein